MAPSNLGLCNKCKARVPAEFFTRDGATWIRKDCPKCGPNESLVSSDAVVWQAKRDMWQYVPVDNPKCTLNCDKCGIDHHPNMVFLDVTNRCNMNCPICIATIRGMGFDFNPPMEYFEKIFAELGSWPAPPVVQLFGGEPTVRDDLLEIVQIARKHGLRPHVVTNGVKLADEEYAKKFCAARIPTRFAFDGRSPDIYEKMRNNRWAYEKKMKGLENLKKYSQRKHAIIAAAAWGINDQYIGDMFQFIHDNRDLISDVGIIPLTENWEPGTFDAAKTTTMEDVEKMVKQAIPGDEVEFVPSGLAYAMKKPRSFFRTNPRSETLLLAGVHPNCESMTLLISDGKRYHGVNYYLKKPFKDVVLDLAARCRTIEPRLDNLDPKKFFQRWRGRLLIIRTLAPWGLKSVAWMKVADGKPVRAFFKAIFGSLFRKQLAEGLSSSRRPRRVLRVGMLPFEEQHSVDAARMESCKAVFAYEDTDDGQVKTIPACLWYPYRNERLEKLSKKYGVVKGGTVVPAKA
jgi:7,8-dihydro-6-hydroxymethylpterin dimethyltransferase